MAVQRDPRLLYGAEIRQRILDDVADDISRLGKRRKVTESVSGVQKRSPIKLEIAPTLHWQRT